MIDFRRKRGGVMRRKALFVVFLAFAMLMPFVSSADNNGSSAGKQQLRNHIPGDVATSKQLERLDGKTKITLAVGLPLHNRDALKAFLADISNPKSKNYRHYLTSQQFIDRYAPTQEEYAKAGDFLKSKGMKIISRFNDRMLINAEGAGSDVESAFNVKLYNYRRPDGTIFYAPDAEPSMDSDVPIEHINGLNSAAVIKTSALTGSGAGGYFMGSDYRNAYIPDAPSSLTGAGQIVGIFALDNYYTADIRSYETIASLPNVAVTNKVVYGSPSSYYNYDFEVTMDIEAVISMAPGCQVYVYEAYFDSTLAGYDSILSAMATDTSVKQFTTSFYLYPMGTTEINYFLKIESQGQSFFHTSGDSGAYAPGAITSYDYEMPDVTIVGGTDLTTSSGAWSSETTWNSSYGKSGGGKSTQIPLPDYQQGITTAANAAYVSTTFRNYPDVSAVAYDVFIVYNNGTQVGAYGTSFSCPLWAGLCALINQEADARGNSPVGFINPAVYNIAKGPNYAADFHDITTGNNGSVSVYPATTGYDLCTGWGSPAGMSLISDLAGPTQTPTPGNTFTPTPATNTNTPTATNTNTPSPTNSATPTFTNTGTGTYSATPTDTSSATDTNTPSPTITNIGTATCSATATYTPGDTNTATPVNTATVTPLDTGTSTPGATNTNTPQPTNTCTQINTATATNTPFPTPSNPAQSRIYPNPLDPGKSGLSIMFNFASYSDNVVMEVYTVAFRKVKSISMGSAAAGENTVTLEGVKFMNMSNGIYYYIITAKTDSGTLRGKTDCLVILK
jgi:subtilase family serine protease